MNTDATGYTVLYSFGGGSTEGNAPQGSLALYGSTLYGTTLSGGTNNQGTFFKISTDGTAYAALHSFGGTISYPPGICFDGEFPCGAPTVSGSMLYGLTQMGGCGSADSGTVFRVNADGTGYHVLHSFNRDANDDGDYPQGSMILSGSKLYGMTSAGGSNNQGTVFVLDLTNIDSAPTVITGHYLPDGTVGAAYSTTLMATGGLAPYTWMLVPQSGELPDGLNLYDNGVISGTPTKSYSGEYIGFTVFCTSFLGFSSENSFGLKINPAPIHSIGLSGNLAFGSVPVGSTATSTLTITNTGNVVLTVSGISYPNGFSGTWSGTIPSGGSQNVTVTFAPSSPASYGGSVAVISDATSGQSSLGVSGVGIPAIYSIAVGGNLAFGTVPIGSSAIAVMTITNTGNSSVAVSGISYPDGFGGSWSGTIAAGSIQNVSVTFAPTVLTNYGGTVTVASDATSGVNTMPASGIGICGYTLSLTSTAVPTAGSSGSITVNAGNVCAWTVSNNVNWVTITSGSSGTGNGTVNYSVASNAGSCLARTGTVTVAGQTFTVTQSAGSGSYLVMPDSASHGAGAETGSFTMTTGTGCSWTASGSASWIHTSSTGTGGGTVNYNVDANTGNCVGRTGTITVAGQVFTVSQDTGTGSYAIFPTARSHGAGAESSNVTVTAGIGCNWTAISNNGFITITSDSSGTGNGTVSYSVAANTSTNVLTGTMTIAGQTFTVTQSGASAENCTYTLNAMSVALAAKGGSKKVSVKVKGTDCSWTAVSNDPFITITSGSSGTGHGTIRFSVPGNTNTAPLTGTISIADQTFTVNQAAGGCTFKLSPKDRRIKAAGGSKTVKVKPNFNDCAWSAVSNDSFITITDGASGVGKGTVSYTIPANTNTTALTGSITIAGETFTITQSGAP